MMGRFSAFSRYARRCVARAGIIFCQYPAYARLMRLHRPIGIWLLLWPTLWGLWIAGHGQPMEKLLIIFVIGTIVMRSAGCIVNDFADRSVDPYVKRTSDRPLATGEVSSHEAFIVFAGLLIVALSLVLTLNRFTQILSVIGLAITVIYPFTKRFISTPQFMLGIAFAWGVPMAFAAHLGEVPRVGWLLFLGAIVWGVIYDTEYAMADREEDLKIGVRSIAILFGDLDKMLLWTLQVIFFGTLVLVGKGEGLGFWYFGGLGAAGFFALYQQYLIKDRDSERCFRAFMSNSALGACIFVGMALDYLFHN